MSGGSPDVSENMVLDTPESIKEPVHPGEQAHKFVPPGTVDTRKEMIHTPESNTSSTADHTHTIRDDVPQISPSGNTANKTESCEADARATLSNVLRCDAAVQVTEDIVGAGSCRFTEQGIQTEAESGRTVDAFIAGIGLCDEFTDIWEQLLDECDGAIAAMGLSDDDEQTTWLTANYGVEFVGRLLSACTERLKSF